MLDMHKNKIYELALCALFIALTFAATAMVNIRLPLPGSGGLIHLGNVPLFVAGMLFGRRVGAAAGAFGMGLFDVLSGWTLWAPFTFAVVGAMGYTVGLIAEKKPFHSAAANDLLSIALAIIIKVAGYYAAEVILYGSWITPAGSIPGNVIQVGAAGAIVFVFIGQLRKYARTGI